MKTKFVFALLFVSMIALSSAQTVFYNNYNDEVISSYSIVYDDYDGFTRTIKITDRYDSLNYYYYYSNYYQYDYDNYYNKDYEYKYWKSTDYRRTSDLEEGQSYYVYESAYREKATLLKCYDEAPKGKLFYTKCP